MKSSAYQLGTSSVLAPREAITQSECADLKLAVADAVVSGSGTLILDLSEVPFIDSTGLELLMDLDQGCRQQGGHFKLAALSENCNEILYLTDLKSRFKIYSSVEKAAKSVV